MGSSLTAGFAAGWYSDPTGRAQLRYWSGNEWTEWVSSAGEMAADPLRRRHRLEASDVAHLTFIDEVFLPEARSRGLLDARAVQEMSGLVQRLTTEALQAPLTPEALTRSAPAPAHQAQVSSVLDRAAHPAPVEAEPRVKEPGALRQWWLRSRESIGSDLAVHGLAYLGALLLFVGAFGLVAFAFGGVEPAWRPVAEVAIAAVPFLTAALLLRRGALIVGRTLELAGGLLLPVMVLTVFLDDVPPDLDGVAMVIVMTGTLLAIAAGYATWSRRHPSSALRFVAAPLVWLAAGVATMGVGRDLPAGAAVASLTAAQVSAIAVALAGTLAVARRRPDHPLAAPAMSAGVVGAVVTAVLAGLTWLAEGWPPAPIVVTGLAGLVVLELLGARIPAAAVAVAQPVWWAMTSLALVAAVDNGPAGVVAAVGFVVLLERTAARRPDGLPLGLAVSGAVGAFAVTFAQPWYGVALAAVAATWVGWRRLRPFDLADADRLLDVAAGLVPVVGLAWLVLATNTLAVAGVVAAGLALVAAEMAARGLLRRDEADRFWSVSWPICAALATGVLASAWVDPATPQQLTWLVPLGAGLLTAACAVGPMAALARPWAVLGFGTTTWLMVGFEIGLDVGVLAVVVAAASLAAVVGAQVMQTRLGTQAAGSLGLAGHVLGVGALVAVAGSAPAAALAAAAATAGFVTTTVADARDASAVGTLLERADPIAHYLPPALAAAGLPVTATLTMDALGVAIWSGPWPVTIVVAVTALGYGLLTRLTLPTYVRQTLLWTACVAAVTAAVMASDRPTALLGLAVVVATAALLPGALRPAPMEWLGWAALAPLVGLLAVELSPSVAGTASTEVAAFALVAVGAMLALGGLLLDGGGRVPVPRWRVARAALVPVVVTGAAELVVGLALATVVVAAPAGAWLTLVVAVVVLAIAVLRGTGVLGGVAVVLAWTATLMLAGQAVVDRPWVTLLVGVGLLALADVSRSWARQPWWARWDVSVFVAAHVVVATGLLIVLEADERPLFVAAVGLLAVVIGWRLRAARALAFTYAMAGGLLVLLGAVDAGSGWTSLAMLGVAAACVAAAARTGDVRRQRWLQIAGAVAAGVSWQQAALWWQLTAQQTVDVTVVGGGLLVLVAAMVLWVRPSTRSWALVWGGVASLVVLLTGLAALVGVAGSVSAPVVVGSGLLVLGWAGAAERVDSQVLRTGACGLLVVTEVQWLSLVDSAPAAQVAVLTVTAGSATLVALAPSVLPVVAPWQRPALGLGALTTLGAVVAAVGAPADSMLLVPTLLVAAGLSAAAGVVLSSVWLRVLAPLLACAAWIVFAAGAMGENPQWYTLPMGLALLVAVALLRQDARARGADPAARGIVTLELVGIAFLVGASFVQAVTTSLVYVALALLLGAGVGAWGLVTKVRRRVVAGGVVVIAAVVVLLAVPLVSLLPSWQGTALWIFLAGAGLVALLAATAIEKGRIIAHRLLERYVALGDAWE